MTPEQFLQLWTDRFSGYPPVGYLLREERCSDIWFRIHTLPLSKRYADTEEEMAEILRRHNTILDELIGPGKPYIFLSTNYSKSRNPRQKRFEHPLNGISMEYFMSFEMFREDETDAPYFWRFFIGENLWQTGSADKLLSSVANEEVSDVLFISEDLDIIYHPYDGGGDFFISDEVRRNELKEKFSAWFSDRPDGL